MPPYEQGAFVETEADASLGGMKASALLPALALLALASCQTTQQTLRPGMVRSGAAFSYSDLDVAGTDVTALDLQVSTGTFFEANQELGVNLGYHDLDAGATSFSTWDLALYGRYYLETSAALLPWFELDLGWADNDVDSAFLWAAGAGISQFMTQGGAVEAALEYESVGGDVDTSGFRILIGYSLFF